MKTFKYLLFGETRKGSIARIIVLLIICLAPFGYHYQPIWIDGISMEPTYDDGQWSLMQRKRSLGKDWIPDRFDVIVVWSEEYNEHLCKRVIGLPGETVRIDDGKVYINNIELTDTFSKGEVTYYERVYRVAVPGGTPWMMRPVDPVTLRVIGSGEVWVVGDNRTDSVFGHFSIDKIRGKIILY